MITEEYLGKQTADDIFFSSFLSGIMNEKQAGALSAYMEKEANLAAVYAALVPYLKDAKGFISSGFNGITKGVDKALDYANKAISTAGKVSVAGLGAGTLGAMTYDVIKERLAHEDPEKKFNDEVSAIYANRKKELEDSRWMDRVRSMRDDLMRNFKHMSTSEYTKKYNALIAALDEKK